MDSLPLPTPHPLRPRLSSVRRRIACAVWCLVLGILWVGDPASAETRRRSLGDGLVAALNDQQEIYLEARPAGGEGLRAFARRLTGDIADADAVAAANGNPRQLLSGVRYRVPLDLLRDDLQARTIRGLFPDDQLLPDGWHHRVPRTARAPSLWRVAEWLTGDGANFAAIRQHNDLPDDSLRPNQVVVVPPALLRTPLRALLPRTTVASLQADDAAPLVYVEDVDGETTALYRLRAGEALYSAVVVRFTGRVLADDVNELAAELARTNGITDVTDMPIGQPVRIPLDLLLPEYLPPGDPRRVEWEANRTESAKYSNPVRARRLEGITIVLDPGHGGDDPGVDLSGTWESTYVYDVMLRVRQLLLQNTSAEVVSTTRDGDGWDIPERDELRRSRRHTVLTDPPYRIEDARVSANLRWYLANSIHRKATKRSGDPDKTLFLSIHADSLHSSLRGAMVYVPATGLTAGEYGKTGAVYTSRREVREKPRVAFSWKERTRSEGLSRQFAERLLASFRARDLAIHREKPIRDRIIRCRRCKPFVPAVVRRNAVPTKVLLEICNLNNAEDRRLLQTRAFRERVAAAIVDGILDYYGQDPLGRSEARVATAD